MGTSIKTTTVAYKILDDEVSSLIKAQNADEEQKYKKSKEVSNTEEDIDSRSKSRKEKMKFQFRKGCNGVNSMLNLYPLLSSDFTNAQKQELEKVFIRLLIELYQKEIEDIERLAKEILKGFYKEKDLSTIAFNTTDDRQKFFQIWNRESKSITQYVTVQEHVSMHKICMPGASKPLLTAFLGKKKVEKIRAIEKAAYYAGEKPSRVKEKEAKELLTPLQLDLSRFQYSNKSNGIKYLATGKGTIIIMGAPKSSDRK